MLQINLLMIGLAGQQMMESHGFSPPFVPPPYLLAGTLAFEGVAAPNHPVAVMDRRSYQFVFATFTKEDGSWQIKSPVKYPDRSLLVLALDTPDGTHNVVGADFITQSSTLVTPEPAVTE